MTKREIKELTISELICRLVINERCVCKEINFGQGLTKKPQKKRSCFLRNVKNENC